MRLEEPHIGDVKSVDGGRPEGRGISHSASCAGPVPVAKPHGGRAGPRRWAQQQGAPYGADLA